MIKFFPYRSVLIVCSVNTARSPMAEAYLKEILSRNNIKAKIHSCGVSSNARDNMLISMDAKLAMKEVGITLSDDASSIDLKKHPELLEGVDLILTLTENHKKEILKIKSVDGIKLCTLKEFAGECGDIEDPSMKGLEGFRITRDKIIDSIMKGLQKISNSN